MIIVLLLLVLMAADPAAPGAAATQPAAPRPPATQPAAPPRPATRPAAPATDAERISVLNRSIEETTARLADLRKSIEDPRSEYASAQADFKKLDDEREAARRGLDKARESGAEDQVRRLSADLEALEQRWKLAKDRFDLAISERKTLQEQIATLEKKLAQDQASLAKLLAPTEPATQPAKPPEPPAPPAKPTTAPSQPPAADAQVEPSPARPLVGPPFPLAPPAEPAESAENKERPPRPPSKELIRAQQEAKQKEEVAEQAERKVQSLAERIDAQKKIIEQEQKLLETAQRKVANALETERTLTGQAQQRSSEGARLDELRDLWSKVGEAQKRHRQAEAEVVSRRETLNRLRDELERLQSEQIAQLEEAERSRLKADEARRTVERLSSPFSLENITHWLLTHGVRIVLTFVVVVVVVWLSGRLESRVVALVAGRAGQGTLAERENRARTLVGVLQYVVNVAVIAGGGLMILTEIGINVAPLLGGAAVLGLAVAFGAQNLIRDYFYGFMILLENQYGLNDVIRIGGVAGVVEKITLRITVLRDVEGIVHFIPNGQIDKVSNMTYGWSRALFDIGISYGSDIDLAMRELVALGAAMRREPAWQHLIMEDPEMLGVDQLGESAVVIRFVMKTRPKQQWAVRREMLRRIRKRFAEIGLEIPFPQRTVHHRYPPPEENRPPPGP